MATIVETKMTKKRTSFTSTFIGLAGYPSDPGQYTESPQVDLNGQLWSIKLYPGGVSEEHKGFISVFLCNCSDRPVRSSFRITVMNQKGLHNRDFNSETIRSFEANDGSNSMHGEPRLVSKNEIRNISNGFYVDDTLIIKADITVFSELQQAVVSAATNSPMKSNIKRSTISDDIASLLFQELFSDCTISVVQQDEGSTDPTVHTIPVHKFVLSLRSPVFRAMLQSDRNGIQLLESVSNNVIITDFDVSIVQELIRFMYTDACSEGMLAEHAEELLAVACKYQILGLEAACEERLCETLTVEKVVGVICLADAFGATMLKKRGLEYLCKNSKEIFAIPGVFEELGFALCQEALRMMAGVTSDKSMQEPKEEDPAGAGLAGVIATSQPSPQSSPLRPLQQGNGNHHVNSQQPVSNSETSSVNSDNSQGSGGAAVGGSGPGGSTIAAPPRQSRATGGPQFRGLSI